MMCPNCKYRPKKKHWNAKWCGPCSAFFKRKPQNNFPKHLEKEARKLAGTMFIKDLADQLGVSRSCLVRWARDVELSLRSNSYDEKTVKQVCKYYEKHGKILTQKRFIGISYRSIVERYKDYAPRQTRWTDEQFVMLARMGGIVSYDNQSSYFERPNSNAGSIKSAWQKKFGHGGFYINGLPYNVAKHFVRHGAPFHRSGYWAKSRGLKLIFWIDAVQWLKDDVPEHLRNAFEAMAKFQKWLHGRYYRASLNRCLEMNQ